MQIAKDDPVEEEEDGYTLSSCCPMPSDLLLS